ncbi:aldo/keto reductase [Altererythrobacter lutimaris]|uniref:Aldo/keto reductase n=1 Tax=Altererythrobacter lutimaris TaxID=2743979 RepID=A0A850HEH1_9SPHN|nr:aldo/keto reductase [Altererythrobacter lutimaris]NVE95915.1 aldo/keto reductase [Altererythrobacter lutimaris]
MSELALTRARRQLGKSGIEVSSLAWGMWRLTETCESASDVVALSNTVLNAGITFFDTADIYGFNGTDGFGDAEALFGKALAEDTSLRGRIVLASKGGIMPPLPYDQSREYMDSALNASLTRLGVEQIDLYQIHRPDILTHPQELAGFLESAIASGKVRAIGVSNFTPAQITTLSRFLDTPLATTQPEISPLRIDPFDNGELDQAIRMGLTPMAWSPLGGGRLMRPESEREHAVARALGAVADAKGIDRAVAAYSWLMAHPAGIIPIIGSQNATRIAEATEALQVQWSRAEWYSVFAASRGAPLP